MTASLDKRVQTVPAFRVAKLVSTLLNSKTALAPSKHEACRAEKGSREVCKQRGVAKAWPLKALRQARKRRALNAER